MFNNIHFTGRCIFLKVLVFFCLNILGLLTLPHPAECCSSEEEALGNEEFEEIEANEGITEEFHGSCELFHLPPCCL